MKNIIKLSSLFTIILLFTISCNQEEFGKDEGKGATPEKVSDVSTEKNPVGLSIKWKNPMVSNPAYLPGSEEPEYIVDTNLEYVKIEYVAGGKTFSQNASRHIADENGYSSIDLEGFPDTEEYTFKLYTCNNNGANHGFVEVKGTPNEPIFSVISPTITVEAGYNAIILKWENEYEKLITIDVTYTAQGTNKTKTTTILSFKEEGSAAISDPIFEEENNTYDVEIVVNDRFGNSGAKRDFEVKPIRATLEKMSPKDWTFPGYDKDSQDGQIGYSSQATNEGTAPNGRVEVIIDENTATFWHARWDPGSKYPHFFIIDLGENVNFAQIGLVGRADDNREKAQKGQRFFTCTDEAAVNKTDTTTWQWVDHGFTEFDIKNAEEQTYQILLDKPARYLKVYFGEEAKGEGDYAMLAELYLYKFATIED